MFTNFFKHNKTTQSNNNNNNNNNNMSDSSMDSTLETIPSSIEEIKCILNNYFSSCSDIIYRDIKFDKTGNISFLIAYINGFVDKTILNQDVVRPVLEYFSNEKIKIKNNTLLEILNNSILINNDIKIIENITQAVNFILSGEAVLFIENESKALVIGVKAPQGRQVAEPDTEVCIRGAREGFVENLLTNTTLIRKRIKNYNLKLEMLQLGSQTKTDICICYIKGIANDDIVYEVKNRLSKINTDSIIDSGYIEQFISDSRLSLFPTVGNSEKCDKLAGKLLEGHIAIFCDGTPYVLTVPYTFIESIQVSDDYYDHAFFATFMRILRLTALLVSNLLPAMYVALICFHHTVIPYKLMITLSVSRQGIPFTPFVEATIMITVFELLREAGVRMPRPIGQALSIVGAIVLGEASVAAGIASNLMVMIVSLTAVCSFVVPPLIRATMLIRFAYLIAANILGFLGISLVLVVVFIHLCRLRSFSVPYLWPFSPYAFSDFKDTFFVVPVWAMLKRPKQFHTTNIYRKTVNANIHHNG